MVLRSERAFCALVYGPKIGVNHSLWPGRTGYHAPDTRHWGSILTLLGIHVSPAPILRAITVAAFLSASEGAFAATSAMTAEPTVTEIQKFLSGTADGLKIDGEAVDAVSLRSFYQARGWRPAWGENREVVMGALAAAELEGLPTRRLHLTALARLAGKEGARQASLDLLITDALLRYAAAMRGQRVDPTTIEDDWFLPVPAFDPVAFLGSHVTDAAQALKKLEPPYVAYQLLRQKLAELRAVAAAGDWPKVPTGDPLKPGTTDDRILAVRKRLAAAALLAADNVDSPLYDDALQAAVQEFQRRHGLLDDGVLGRQTVVAMNVSAAERARQVALNMERWRWLPPHLEENHIVVNVPGAWLEVVENGKAVMTMKVVVGDPDHPTPAMHAKMTSLVLNPIWRIPASIATNEILPKLKKDPGYLMANDLELVSDSFAPGSSASQGVGISWKELSTMPWPVRQRAGSDNALGRIKFNIPNSDDIYLHDTPNRKAFGRTFRALSHGCVRVEKPDELALYVLSNKDWTAAKLDQSIETGETRTVTVARHLPVWLLYWTTWVDAQGVLQFRDDIYGRDQRLAIALGHSAKDPSIIDHHQVVAPQVVRCDGCRLP
jgi:L,D-transpeptidase YcbB